MDKSKIFAIVGITALAGIGVAYLLSKPKKLPPNEPKKDVNTADDFVNNGGGGNTGGGDTDTGGGGDTSGGYHGNGYYYGNSYYSSQQYS